MAEPELTHVEQAMLYRSGEMTAEEKAAFEPHLATCETCQAAIRKMDQVLPFVNSYLAFRPKHTIDEQVARFAAVRAAKAQSQRRARTLWVVAGFAAAAIALIVVALQRPGVVPPSTPPRPDHLYAPVPPQYQVHPDAGDAGP